MSEVLLHSGLSLLEARRVADAAGMVLVTDGRTVVVAPQVLPGWWEVPLTLRREPDSAADHAAPARAAALLAAALCQGEMWLSGDDALAPHGLLCLAEALDIDPESLRDAAQAPVATGIQHFVRWADTLEQPIDPSTAAPADPEAATPLLSYSRLLKGKRWTPK